MAELNPPWALQNLATHTANVNRMMLTAMSGFAEGIVYTGGGIGGMFVNQRGAGSNMSVDVNPGVAMVFGDDSVTQGLYGCVNDAIVNKSIAAADPTNPRRDLVVARVRDAFYSGATNAWDLFVVTGTPAASPADPAIPNNCLVLCRVAVAANAASITNANITDLRPFVPLGVYMANSARPPGVLYGPFSQEPTFKPVPLAGQMMVEGDTLRLKQYDGTVWRYVAGGTQPQYSARMYRNAALGNLAAAITTLQIPYDTVDYDYNSNITLGASAHYTAPVAGLCEVYGNQQTASNNSVDCWDMSIWKNGSTEMRRKAATSTGSEAAQGVNLDVQGRIPVAAGDTLDIRIKHTIGGNPNSLSNGNVLCYAEFRML
jgi:hypothetical protein